MFGFINIYKPKGITSHDVISVLRRITKIKQIGHTGTLDPFAEGVLPVCIGKATRLIEFLNDDKAYIGTVQLGKSTTTYDIEGEEVNRSDKAVNIDQIKKELENFKGDIEQLPPVYSAIKVKGKKLYEYARKGETVEIARRRVSINKLEVLNYDPEKRTLELYIDCSKGTYIRSIANDLGEKLGTYGHLSKLVRVKAGDFIIDDAVRLENLNSIDDVKKNLINTLEKLKYPMAELNEKEKNKVSHGMDIYKNTPNEGVVILVYNNELAAVAKTDGTTVRCLKVFV